MPLSTVAGYTDAATVDGAVEIVVGLLGCTADDGHFASWLNRLCGTFFLRHGKKYIGVLLAEIGVTPEMVTNEVYALVVPGLDVARQSGYLEQRIGAAAAFYTANAVMGNIDGDVWLRAGGRAAKYLAERVRYSPSRHIRCNHLNSD